MQQVNLDSEKYEQFLRCLSVLKDICNDTDIRGGVIRQKTNDLATVFEMDLSPIIENLDIPLINLKTKIELFKIFSQQTVEIIVNDDRSFSFSDQFTTLNFEGPDLDYMDNKFISEEELSRIFTFNQDDLILTTDISKVTSDRIKTISQAFNVNSIKVKFENDTVSLNMQTQSLEQNAKIMSGIITERQFQATSSLINTPFIFDHDGDIVFKMFNYRESICSNQFTTSINDVNIKVYSRSELSDN